MPLTAFHHCMLFTTVSLSQWWAFVIISFEQLQASHNLSGWSMQCRDLTRAQLACFLFLWFPACLSFHALHGAWLLPCALVAWGLSNRVQALASHQVCMKLLTPNGCRNTRGQVCCIAIAACNAVQQLAGYCTQPWPALNGQYMCTKSGSKP